MSFHIVDPWPTAEAVQSVQREAVTFESSDPFVPARIGQAPARAVRGQLFMPPGAASPHATPAIVMLHGSAGMIYDRIKYGPQLASIGLSHIRKAACRGRVAGF